MKTNTKTQRQDKKHTKRTRFRRWIHRHKLDNINWLDVRVWIIPIAFLFLTTSCHKSESVPVEPVLYATECTTIPEVTEDTEPEPDPEEEIIVALSRFADSVGSGRSDDVKRAIVWVVINRVEDRSHGYGSSIQGELERPRQWQGYNPYANYTEHTYQLVKDIYQTWQSGGARMFQTDMLWFVLETDGSVTVRNKFNETRGRAESNIE